MTRASWLRPAGLVKWVPWVALVLVLVVALAIGASRGGGRPTVEQRVQHITSQLRCPVCQGETVADSGALISRDIRADVQQRVQAGQPDRQIIGYVVHQYPGTLLNPPASGVSIIVWALPVIVVIVACVALAAGFARWRSRPADAVSEQDRALVERALGR